MLLFIFVGAEELSFSGKVRIPKSIRRNRFNSDFFLSFHKKVKTMTLHTAYCPPNAED